MTGRLRAGVIGTGVFGRLHAQKYADLGDVELSAVFDPDATRAAALAGAFGARPCSRPAMFWKQVDLVTIAVPAVHHFDWGCAALAARKHFLLEKPVAARLSDGRALAAAAVRHPDLVTAMGHQERIAARALGLFSLIAVKGPPLAVSCVRVGPWTGRGADVSATLDLMTHDFDLLHALLPEPPLLLEAKGEIGPSGMWDQVSARLDSGGVRVALSVSRMARERCRTMNLRFADGEVEVDFLARAVRVSGNITLPGTGFPGSGFPDSARSPDASPDLTDPIGVNVANFVRAVQGHSRAALVSLDDGLAALQLALATDSLLDSHSGTAAAALRPRGLA